MKIAFTGKGGVGKTTLASLFIRTLAKTGKEVLAVDCDPTVNLARALGFSNAEKVTPIVEMQEMINERMGVAENDKTFFKLNPKIDDISGKFALDKGNIKLIVMGAVEKGGSGCMCPENAFVKNLLSHLIVKGGEHIVMDMEAGLEHLGRATAGSCDFVLTIVEPSVNAIETARKIKHFAGDIGIKKVYAIGNKTRSSRDADFIKRELKDIKLIDTIDFNESFLDMDKDGALSEIPDKISSGLEGVRQFLEGEINK